jgi:energy-coupling factor transport system substrate-specific component
VLAGYAVAAGLGFGLIMNIWFWPFASYGPEVSYVAGDALAENVGRYTVFYLTTSLLWDLGRSLMSLLVILLAGTALLRALRRASRRAAFDAPVVFER